MYRGYITFSPCDIVPPNSSSTKFNLILPFPEPFDIDRPELWTRWLDRWNRYYRLMNLQKNLPEVEQIDTFLYCLGESFEHRFADIKIPLSKLNSYKYIVDFFNQHFIALEKKVSKDRKTKKLQDIRTDFMQRKQSPGESAFKYITDVLAISDLCNFEDQRDSLVKTIIIFGMRDVELAKKLLFMDISLDECIKMVIAKEALSRYAGDIEVENCELAMKKKKSLIPLLMPQWKESTLN